LRLGGPAFVLAVVLVIAPATIRNYRVADDFVLISSNAGINLFIGNNEQADGRVSDEIAGLGQFATCYDYPALVAKLEEQQGRALTHSEVSGYFVRQALGFIRREPLEFVKLTARKARLFWGADEVAHNKAIVCERRFSSVLGKVPGNFAAVVSLAVVGVAMLVREWRRKQESKDAGKGSPQPSRELVTLILLLTLTYFVSVVPFFVSARYRAPITPFLLLFAAYGVCRLVGLIRKYDYRAAGVWGVIAVGLYLLTGASSEMPATDVAKWHCDRGLAYYQQGRLEEAIAEYREALKVSPGFKAAEINLASVLGEQGNLDEAIARALDAVRRNPNVAAVRNNLALTLTQAGRIAEAEKHYLKAVELQPDLLEVRFNLSALLAKEGRLEEAVGQLREAVRVRPESAEARLQLGAALQLMGRVDEAETNLRTAVSLDENNLRAHLALGGLLAARGKVLEATRLFERAVEIDPESTQAHNGLGTVRLRAGKWADAERCYRKALQLDPDLAIAHFNLGLALEKQSRPDEALEELKTATRLDPSQVKAQIALGNILRQLGRQQEAAEAYRQAAQIAPNDAEARFVYGLAMHDAGELDTAIAEYEAALQIDPNHTQARQALELARTAKGRE
jgi:tetratricopeptide (TPR) repeat protein